MRGKEKEKYEDRVRKGAELGALYLKLSVGRVGLAHLNVLCLNVRVKGHLGHVLMVTCPPCHIAQRTVVSHPAVSLPQTLSEKERKSFIPNLTLHKVHPPTNNIDCPIPYLLALFRSENVR